jgi:hypothetical protein
VPRPLESAQGHQQNLGSERFSSAFSEESGRPGLAAAPRRAPGWRGVPNGPLTLKIAAFRAPGGLG